MQEQIRDILKANGYSGDEMDGLPSIQPPSVLSEIVLLAAWVFGVLSLGFALFVLPLLLIRFLGQVIP